MSAQTINQHDVKTYVQVTSMNGSYYFAWVSLPEVAQLASDYYVVTPAKRAPRSDSPRREVTLANTDDHIADVCFMLACSIFDCCGEEENRDDELSQTYANGLRTALETLVESLGQELLKPPTKATQGLIDMWTRRMVQKFHTYDVIELKRKAAKAGPVTHTTHPEGDSCNTRCRRWGMN